MKRETYFTDINNRQDAYAFDAAKKLNSIDADLHICKMNMVSILEKVDALLNAKNYKATLTEDQILYLEALRERYRKNIDLTDSVQKSI